MASPFVWLSWLITISTAASVLMIAVTLHRGARSARAAAGARRAAWLATALLAGWLLLAGTLAAAGFFSTAPGAKVPRIAYAVIPLLAGYAFFFMSPALRSAFDGIPAAWLIGLQVNRLLGATFLVGYALGFLPAAFALPAGIGDMLIGLTALPVAALVSIRHPSARFVATLWNLAGIGDLLLAVGLGVLTAPGRLGVLGSPNIWISRYPFVLIPATLVPLWFMVHTASLRSLARTEPLPSFEQPGTARVQAEAHSPGRPA